MESNGLIRPSTFRVENIPPGTTAEDLKKYFYPEDQPHLHIRSIVPAVDNCCSDDNYTATVTFQGPDQRILSPRTFDDNLSIDSDFHGFTPLNHPREPIVADIIAVTGLAAHPFGSWAHSSQNMWLRDYLPRDLSNARVLLYGYPSQLHKNMSRTILSDHSNDFIHKLLIMRDSAKCPDRPIVFIGHCLGCLIIKKALNGIYGSVGIYSSRLPVRSIIFLGAPHRGLQIVALETLFKSRPTEGMIRELKLESPALIALDDNFRHVAKGIDILTCYELSPTKTAIEMPDGSWIREGPPIMMVSLDSARLFYPREKLVACNADHSQIAKLERGENGIYPNIKWAVQQVLPDVTELSRLQVPFDSSGENGESLRGSSFDAQDPQYQREREKARAANWRVSQVPGHYNPARKPSLPAGPLPIGEVLSSENAANLAKESVLDEDLASAIKAGKAERVRDLVLESYDINCRDKYGQTPLLLAASLRQEEVLKEVLKLGADTLAVDSIGSTTLHIISIPKSGQRPLTKSVMDQLLHHKPPLEVKTPDGNTPLLTSARFGATQAAKSLIHQGASVSVTTEHGSTPLHRALEYGQEEIAELLVASGAPFEARENTEEKFTPLHRAVLNNETSANMIRILLQAEANREAASAASKRTPLMLAMFRNNEACVDELLKAGANINAMQKDGYRPLHVATHHGKLSFTEMLLQHGADLEVTTNDLNMTPLMVAIASGNDPCVKVMLESGADIETEHFCGWRPLHLATRLGRLEVIETLLVHGANPCARTPAESLMKTGLEAWKTPSSLGIDKTVTDSRKKQILRMLKDAEDSWKNNDSKVGL